MASHSAGSTGLPETRTDETRAAEAATGHSIAFVEIWGRRLLRVNGTADGRAFDTFVDADDGVGRALSMLRGHIREPHFDQEPGDALRAIAAAERVEHAEQLRLLPITDARGRVEISLVVPGAGLIDDIDASSDLEKVVARQVRMRREDSEGRETPTICAMAVGMVADDIADLERIIDTVFSGTTSRYRGVRSTLKRQDLVVAEVEVDQIRIGEHGVDVRHLAETIRTAIHGRSLERRPLRDLVDIPGFGDLLIRQVTRHGGSDNMRVAVADARMADLPRLDRDGALDAAMAVLRARGRA